MENPIEKAFWEWSEPYTGMRLVDMYKSSHGRGFIAGWRAAEKHRGLDKFCYWLQGYVELTDCTIPNQHQWAEICNRLRQVVSDETEKL